MIVRPATEADRTELERLYDAFEAEVPEPDGFTPKPFEVAWQRLVDDLEHGAVYVADDEAGRLLGYIDVSLQESRAHVAEAYVEPEWRQQGLLRSLLQASVARVKGLDVSHVTLEVLVSNEPAAAVWRRLGFETIEHVMIAPVDALAERLEPRPVGESRAATHVQTDDELSVERAITHFIPRLEAVDVRSNGSWIRVADPVLDHDRDAHGRFAHELSERLGAVCVALSLEYGSVVRFRLYERGRMVDEYLSIPTFYGSLPVGDELALAANPTLVARLTGASPDDVRRVARTAKTAAELPPAPQLYEAIADLMGLEP
jgi:ribosomal protein S18 acetylase RimI-like enzyme